MPDGKLRSALTELLGQIQDAKEVRAYLDRFGATDRARFAIFKIGGAVLERDLDDVAAGLSLLNQVGLTPIVVHGAGPQLDREVGAAGVDAGKVDGLRVSPPEVMAIASHTAMRTATGLATAIGRHGGAAMTVSPVAVRAAIKDEARYGRVGEPTAVDADLIADAARSGAIPILSSLGVDEDGRVLNVNADSVARALALAIEPLKIVFVTGTGGLLDRNGEIIPSVNIDAELDALVADGTIGEGMLVKLREIETLLAALPRATSVSITSAGGMVRELFTHGGAGTLVRRGERIETYDGTVTLDRERLNALIETAFGRPLRDPGSALPPDATVYVTENYRAAAVLLPLERGTLLDKFVVDPDARGEGLTHSLWRLITERHTPLFWRSRRQNGFNEFYRQRADGMVRRDPWSVFWTGEIALRNAATLIDEIAKRPGSFEGDT